MYAVNWRVNEGEESLLILSMSNYYLYIMSNPSGTLYIGITNNLHLRVGMRNASNRKENKREIPRLRKTRQFTKTGFAWANDMACFASLGMTIILTYKVILL